jgi:hypothetical protein
MASRFAIPFWPIVTLLLTHRLEFHQLRLLFWGEMIQMACEPCGARSLVGGGDGVILGGSAVKDTFLVGGGNALLVGLVHSVRGGSSPESHLSFAPARSFSFIFSLFLSLTGVSYVQKEISVRGNNDEAENAK